MRSKAGFAIDPACNLERGPGALVSWGLLASSQPSVNGSIKQPRLLPSLPAGLTKVNYQHSVAWQQQLLSLTDVCSSFYVILPAVLLVWSSRFWIFKHSNSS